MSSIAIGHEFVATFVPAKNGLQTAERVNKRRAFPDRKGPQPNNGETWKVKLSGQNPSGTVHFVVCLSRVEETPVEDIAPQAARNNAAKSARPVDTTVRAAGGNVYERAVAWLTPVKNAGLSDLAFVVSQRHMLTDSVCLDLREFIKGIIDAIDENRGVAQRLQQRFSELGRWNSLGEQARELVTARATMAKLLADKAVLAKDTLDYARLCKRVKAQTEVSDTTLADEAAFVKAALDERRAALKSGIEQAEQALRGAEDNRYWSSDEETFDELCQNLLDQEQSAQTASRLTSELEQAVVALEARLVEVRNGK